MADRTQLFVHAGFPKTGSSALQYWLYTHADALAEAGVFYPKKGRSAEDAPGHVTAGNGQLLGHFLVPRFRRPDFDLDGFPGEFRHIFLPKGAAKVVISHEQIAAAGRGMLRSFKKNVVPDIDLTFVFFVRDIYNVARAAWTQRIKRTTVPVDFEEYMYSSRSPINNLRNFVEAVGIDNVKVIHYESVSNNIVGAFLDAIGVGGAIDAEETRVRRVNRSLTDQEARVLAECGRVHGQRKIARLLSDHFMDQHWATAPAHIPDPAILENMAHRYSAEIAWVNDTFFEGRNVFGAGELARPETQPDTSGDQPANMDEGQVWREVALILAKEFSEQLGQRPSREELRGAPKNG